MWSTLHVPNLFIKKKKKHLYDSAWAQSPKQTVLLKSQKVTRGLCQNIFSVKGSVVNCLWMSVHLLALLHHCFPTVFQRQTKEAKVEAISTEWHGIFGLLLYSQHGSSSSIYFLGFVWKQAYIWAIAAVFFSSTIVARRFGDWNSWYIQICHSVMETLICLGALFSQTWDY